MDDKITYIIEELREVADDVRTTFGGLSAAQLNWKPNDRNWSVGQCLEHLIITDELYFPNIQKVLDGDHRNNFFSAIPFSTNIIAALMKNSLRPDQKRKMKTFKVFEPTASDIGPDIVNSFLSHQEMLIAMAIAAKGLDLNKIKISEPISPVLNLRLIDAFEILLFHEQRHVVQAKNVFAAAPA